MKYDLLIILLVVVSVSLSLLTIFSSYSLVDDSTLVAHAAVANGNVSLDIASYISIALNDSIIDFGSCAINTSTNSSLFDSNRSSSWLDNSLCINGTFPDFMVVENDGTESANISVQINQTGAVLFNDSNAWFAFKSFNNSFRPGCLGVSQSSYRNFSFSVFDYSLCTELDYIPSNDQINFYMQAYVTTNSSGGGNTTVQFTASTI